MQQNEKQIEMVFPNVSFQLYHKNIYKKTIYQE